jgi:hypothetical protein
MADRSWSRAPGPPCSVSASPVRTIRSDRRRSRPTIESLEGRTLLTGPTSPTNPVSIQPEPIDTPTPQQLGATYREIVAIQASTLQGLSAAHRRLYAAFDQFAARVNPTIARDRLILQQGVDLTSRTEQGLVIAQGVEGQTASQAKIYLVNGLYPSGLKVFVRQARTTGSDLVRSAQRSTNAVVQKLNALGDQLAESIV